MRWKDTREDRRQQLGDDLRRISGFLAAALGEAKALGVEVPEEIADADERDGCVAALARWGREIRDRVPRSEQEER
jgi:predicted flap endonuclease-1-like 5' DNA nuclease